MTETTVHLYSSHRFTWARDVVHLEVLFEGVITNQKQRVSCISELCQFISMKNPCIGINSDIFCWWGSADTWVESFFMALQKWLTAK